MFSKLALNWITFSFFLQNVRFHPQKIQNSNVKLIYCGVFQIIHITSIVAFSLSQTLDPPLEVFTSFTSMTSPTKACHSRLFFLQSYNKTFSTIAAIPPKGLQTKPMERFRKVIFVLSRKCVSSIKKNIVAIIHDTKPTLSNQCKRL